MDGGLRNGRFEPLEFGDWQSAAVDSKAVVRLAENAVCGDREVVEVGTWMGATAIRLADAGFLVHAIDHWRGSRSDYHIEVNWVIADELSPRTCFEIFARNVGSRLFRTIWPHVGSSATYATIWPRPVRLVFIDAAHDYESVRNDIESWWPHVLPGGVLCGHDFELFPGVNKAATEFGIDGNHGEIWYRVKELATKAKKRKVAYA